MGGQYKREKMGIMKIWSKRRAQTNVKLRQLKINLNLLIKK